MAVDVLLKHPHKNMESHDPRHDWLSSWNAPKNRRRGCFFAPEILQVLVLVLGNASMRVEIEHLPFISPESVGQKVMEILHIIDYIDYIKHKNFTRKPGPLVLWCICSQFKICTPNQSWNVRSNFSCPGTGSCLACYCKFPSPNNFEKHSWKNKDEYT